MCHKFLMMWCSNYRNHRRFSRISVRLMLSRTCVYVSVGPIRNLMRVPWRFYNACLISSLKQRFLICVFSLAAPQRKVWLIEFYRSMLQNGCLAYDYSCKIKIFTKLWLILIQTFTKYYLEQCQILIGLSNNRMEHYISMWLDADFDYLFGVQFGFFRKH